MRKLKEIVWRENVLYIPAITEDFVLEEDVGFTALGNFRKKQPPSSSWVHLCCLATALHLFWFSIMFHAGQAPLAPSLKHQGMVPSWWTILSQIPMHGCDWKRRPEREVLCHTLDLWRQFEGILQQEANSQGQAGPKGRGVAKAPE